LQSPVPTAPRRATCGVSHGFTGYPGALQNIDVPGASNTVVEGSNNRGLPVGTYDIERRVVRLRRHTRFRAAELGPDARRTGNVRPAQAQLNHGPHRASGP